MTFEYSAAPPGMLMVHDDCVEMLVSSAQKQGDEYTLTFYPEEGLRLRSYFLNVDLTLRKEIAIMKYPLAFYEK